jgi:hypothetical protein
MANDKLARKIEAAREAQKAQFEKVKDIEDSMLALAEDLKYPLDVYGNVLDMNHLPDVSPALCYHLIRRGWRRDDSKALIKPRKVVGAGYYEDLVAYVDVKESDDPIVVPQTEQPAADLWSVTPKVNMIDEERPA